MKPEVGPEGLLIEPIFDGPKSALDRRALLSSTLYRWHLRIENRTRQTLHSVALKKIEMHFPGGLYETLGALYLTQPLPRGQALEVGDFTTLFPAPGVHWLTCVVQVSPRVEVLQRRLDGKLGSGLTDDPKAPPGTWRGPFAVSDRGVELQVCLNRIIAAMTGAVLLLTVVTTLTSILRCG